MDRFDKRVGDNEYIFRELLKQHRISMGPANRAKTKKFKNPKQIYPSQYERKYFKQISKWMKQFTSITNEVLNENLDEWIETYNLTTKKDSHEIKQNWTEDFEAFIYGEHNDSLKEQLYVSPNIYEIIKYQNSNIRTDDYSSEFKSFIDELYEEQSKQFVIGEENVRTFVSTIGYDVSDFNQKQWQKQVKKLIGTTFVIGEAWEAEVIKTWADTNFTLIKSLSDEYIKKVNFIVSDGVQTGLGSKEIKGQIKKLNKNITEPRARLIARDQVGKLNGLFTKRRQQEVGVDLYDWVTAGDERVRKSHRGLDNTINKWGDSSVYSTDGGLTWQSRTGGMTKFEPGQDAQCRCDGAPYFDELIEEIDKEIKAEQKRQLEAGPSGF
jgi:SPP1 gp7 family putative phage head morphogenesis protein